MPVFQTLQVNIAKAMLKEMTMTDQPTNEATDAGTRTTWLIWDGECGFCRHCVDWLRARDGERYFRITSFQTCPSPPMTPTLRAESERAVQIVTDDGNQISGGRAVLFILHTIGWHPTLLRIAAKPPIVWIVEIGYRVVSHNRGFFSRILFRERSRQH